MSDSFLLNDHPLPLYSRHQVATVVGLSLQKLNFLVYKLPSRRRYTIFSIPRRAGRGTRTIHAPIKPFKDIQSKLAIALETCYRPPAPVHGYIRNRSILSNAVIHSGKHWVLRIDLEDFFPSINFGRVRGLFMAYPFNYMPDVATLLAQICCHENQLPHGAPTSPIISNLICRGLDKDLLRIALQEHCHYSRYCDDLVFSTNRSPFPHALATRDDRGLLVVGPEVTQVVVKHGFRVNSEKTRLRPYTQRQMVTGLVVNRSPNIPREYVRSLRNLLYIWRRHSEEEAAAQFFKRHDWRYRPDSKPPPTFRRIVRGRVQYVGHVKGWTDSVYLGLAKALAAVDDGFKEPRIPPSGGPTKLRVLVEGPTDVLHLEAALKWFVKKGYFTDLELTFQEQNGDQELLRAAKTLPRLTQGSPNICLFDRDNPAILKDVCSSQEEPKEWGNGVFSFAILVPPYRNTQERICIEMLYRDEVLRRTDKSGRRLYLRSEFSPQSGMHIGGHVHCTNPQSKTVVVEEVYKNNQKVSLSKHEFAQLISKKTQPFDIVSFEGFRSIFETLDRIRSGLTGPPA